MPPSELSVVDDQPADDGTHFLCTTFSAAAVAVADVAFAASI